MDSNDRVLMAEFRFVQNYLFSIPKLRAMLQANQGLARCLSTAALDLGRSECGVDVPELEASLFKSLANLEFALLKSKSSDRPLDNLSRGVLASAGGHFEAIVTDPNAAIWRLRRLIQEHAPGLEVGVAAAAIDLNGSFEEQDRQSRESLRSGKFQASELAGTILGHPYMQTCNLTGLDPAVTRQSRFAEELLLGERANKLLFGAETADPRANQEEEQDSATFVEQCLLLGANNAVLPQEFSEFFHEKEFKKHIAIIVIDGNNVGEQLKKFQNEELGNLTYSAGVVGTELYFYRLRLLMRIALTSALLDTLGGNRSAVRREGSASEPEILPVRVLMLGGDDALLAIHANHAVDFILNFSKRWDQLLGRRPGKDMEDSHSELLQRCRERFGSFTFKAGIAIVPHNYPFYAAHTLASELASEAKRISKDLDCSAVDWHILYSSTPESVSTMRSREYFERYCVNTEEEALELTERPYPVNSVDSVPHLPSLTSQWKQAQALCDAVTCAGSTGSRLARSKLKLLRSLARIGRREVTLLVKEIEAETGVTISQSECFSPIDEGRSCSTYRTGLIDVLELHDLLSDRARAQSTAGIQAI